MYATMIALLVIVSLTGFIDRGKSVTLVADGTTRQVYTHAVNEQALMRENNIDMKSTYRRRSSPTAVTSRCAGPSR